MRRRGGEREDLCVQHLVGRRAEAVDVGHQLLERLDRLRRLALRRPR